MRRKRQNNWRRKKRQDTEVEKVPDLENCPGTVLRQTGKGNSTEEDGTPVSISLLHFTLTLNVQCVIQSTAFWCWGQKTQRV